MVYRSIVITTHLTPVVFYLIKASILPTLYVNSQMRLEENTTVLTNFTLNTRTLKP